jgi:hypothetical protein
MADEATDRLRREGTRSRSEICALSFTLPYAPSAHAILVANESRRNFAFSEFGVFQQNRPEADLHDQNAYPIAAT